MVSMYSDIFSLLTITVRGVSNKHCLLAHLRLIGELIVYKGFRRPSVHLSTFSNDISSEAVRPILFIFQI